MTHKEGAKYRPAFSSPRSLITSDALLYFNSQQEISEFSLNSLVKTKVNLMYKLIIVFFLSFLTIPLVYAKQNMPDHCVNIKIELTSVGLGVGGTWGDGELTLGSGINKQTYYFTASGLSLAEAGVAMFSASGSACHPSDTKDSKFDISKLPGIYGGFSGGIDIFPGIGGSVLWNESGVNIKLRSHFLGVFVGLPLKSLILKMK